MQDDILTMDPQSGQGTGAQEPDEFYDHAVICNVNPFPTPLQMRTYNGPYVLNYPRDGQEYALTVIGWRKGYLDRGEYNPLQPSTRSDFVISAKGHKTQGIADDLCREINSNIVGLTGVMEGGSFWGVFVCEGDRPTPEELATAHRRFKSVLQNLVQMGDVEWSRYHKYDLIPDTCRMAAKQLGLEKEWAYNAMIERVACPACGQDLPAPTVAICSRCGVPLVTLVDGKIVRLTLEQILARDVSGKFMATPPPKTEKTEKEIIAEEEAIIEKYDRRNQSKGR